MPQPINAGHYYNVAKPEQLEVAAPLCESAYTTVVRLGNYEAAVFLTPEAATALRDQLTAILSQPAKEAA